MNKKLRPNLFLIGAMKSGTSSLHVYLGAHPEIFMSDPKEPSFFVEPAQLHEEWPVIAAQPFSHDEAAYLELFQAAGTNPVIGEASTNYAKLYKIDGVAERIHAFNPDARFIYVMRDPVERTLSHYWHEVKIGRETLDPFKAICDTLHYREVSYYALQLRPYIERFGRDRIKTLTFEELVASPENAIHDLYRWLGVNHDFVPDDLGERKNATPVQMEQVRRPRLLHRFRYSHFWNALGPHMPRTVRRLGRYLAERRINRPLISVDDVVTYLRPIQKAQTEELRELLGRDFPEWKTLYGNASIRSSQGNAVS